MSGYYAGIGSRETPKNICEMMHDLAARLEHDGWWLRSGGAPGADQAFASGCNNKKIYVPWDGFEGHSMVFPILEEATSIASQIHPGWVNLKPGARRMMARNCMQMLGENLNDPSKFVICWTPDGCIEEATRNKTPGMKTGGTGQAIAHASRLGIPVFNLQRPDHYQRFASYLNK